MRSIEKSEKKTLPMPTKSIGYLHGYLDPNPTNCCNAWFCPAGTSKGYPKFSNHNEPEYGTYSYAAFLYGCTFDCLFCQNSSHKNISTLRKVNVEDMVEDIFNNSKITCVCFFGGTPEPQLPFTINLSERLLEKVRNESPDRNLRIFWEWNGSGKRSLVKRCMELALRSGGNIKFDLKAYFKKLNFALCGVSNERTIENFKFLAQNYFGHRNDLPELSGCTLLVPGYTIEEDVEKIAQFISSLNSKIPYSLLVFHPDYKMKDLPITPKKQVYRCLEVAREYLENVHLGNRFLV
ncbi:MAG: radical SAM protein [Candidatus Lokiarchaeota archaeon]|nr:radical SAM protein [Candidatus Lokiarchaeota archaeon]MBD3200367.1 radical SAM protein [Candidatus Lokiarchaeota archaeon]